MCVSPDVTEASKPAPTGRVILLADAAVDAMGTSCAPAAVVVDNDRIEAVGNPADIGASLDVPRVDLSGRILLPGLVNAHSHIDLSGPGPLPPDSDFRRWLGGVRRIRSESSAADRTVATTRGLQLLRAGGTVAVGDIVGHPSGEALDVLLDSTMRGVAFVEVFGLGPQQSETVNRLLGLSKQYPQRRRMRLGCSPHAPYSCGPDVFGAADATGLPVATHLAESAAEQALLEHGTGALRDLLVDDVGIPAESLPRLPEHAVTFLAPYLHGALCVHLNCIDSEHADTLASIGAVACLCPRATVYFGRDVPGPMPLLRAAGVPIVLGTDALLCLDTPNRISVLDDMRLLHRVNAAAPLDLLAMGTTAAASAIGVEPNLVDLRPGPSAGLISLPLYGRGLRAEEALRCIFESDAAPRWAIGPT